MLIINKFKKYLKYKEQLSVLDLIHAKIQNIDALECQINSVVTFCNRDSTVFSHCVYNLAQ